MAEFSPRRCFSTQEFARFGKIPLSILGDDQQNLENLLPDFKWSGDRLAHMFPHSLSTASHKRQRTLLEASKRTLFFITETLSKKLCTCYRWGIRCVAEVGDYHGQEPERGLKCDFDSSRKKWTFGSSLLQDLMRTRGSVGQSEGIKIPRLLVRFCLNPRTQIHRDLSCIDV